MNTYLIRIRPQSAFGGPFKGDTLFGQLCWAALQRWGESRLDALLEGYLQGQPFLVCSDALPSGYLPRPAWPLYRFEVAVDADRKRIKQRRWLPLKDLAQPLHRWLDYCLEEHQVVERVGHSEHISQEHPQPHNSIDRRTGTTGGGDFAPYHQVQHWYASGLTLDLWMLVDDARLTFQELQSLLADVGAFGYGRDASIGLGKFSLERESCEARPLPTQERANACLTLAPCAPQQLGINPATSYYDVFTRFGRHGERLVQQGNPFKTPVLLAQTGALLQPSVFPEGFIGQGLGGEGLMSKVEPKTVQQGYAPFIGVRLQENAP